MPILVLSGDQWHNPAVARAGLTSLERHGLAFDFLENANNWSESRMNACPLTILTKSNNVSHTDNAPWVTETVEAAFLNYVRKGNSLLVIHSGSASYENHNVLRELIGGVFISHPEQCPVTVDAKVNHRLGEGAAPFTLKDEHYQMALDDPHADVFLTTTSTHGTQPGGWTRTEGAGRVAVLTPGHNLDVWLHPSYQQLILNTVRWCLSSTGH
jgi:uncharacterized protein